MKTTVLVAVAFAMVAMAFSLKDPECEVSSGSVHGDPHFHGFQGQNFDFDGTPFGVFTLFVTPQLVINSRFVPDLRYETKTVLGEVGLYSRLSQRTVHITCTNSTLDVAVDGRSLTHGATEVVDTSLLLAYDSRLKKLTVHADDFAFTFTRHKTRNLGCFIDMEASVYKDALSSLDGNSVDGLLGRTLDSDRPLPTAAQEQQFEIDSNTLFGIDSDVVKQIPIGEQQITMRPLRRILQHASCGCVDTAAHNYDPSALYNDDSCIFFQTENLVLLYDLENANATSGMTVNNEHGPAEMYGTITTQTGKTWGVDIDLELTTSPKHIWSRQGGYISVNNPGLMDLQSTDELTMGVWMQQYADTTNTVHLHGYGYSSNPGTYIADDPFVRLGALLPNGATAGRAYLNFGDHRDQAPTSLSNGVTLDIFQWYEMVMTLSAPDSVTGVRVGQLYVNGQLAFTYDGVAPALTNPPYFTWLAAEENVLGGVMNFVDGKVGKMYMYNRALSAAEVQKNYDNSKDVYTATP